MHERCLRVLLPASLALGLLAAWEVIVRVEGIPPYILPGPLAILAALWRDWPVLLPALLVTLEITAVALLAAALGGAGLAILFALSRTLELGLLPFAVALQVVPVVSIAPVILVYVEEVSLALVLCAWLVAFFPVLSNTLLGLRRVDPHLRDLFILYGATRLQRLLHLELPSALPHFMAGLRISGGLALVGAVVAEFAAGTSGARAGLAFRLLEAGWRLEIPRMFAALLLLALTGVTIYLLLALLERLLLGRWHRGARMAE